ncbi:GPP34 family phosphoprotein [Nonomuraea fuscirosea]|uniref:GPP34 family phosphoprotein n=1 Tax=Nonomuraea fuscirosea TaxID=1291556 RepID=UPI0034499F95
METPAKQTEPLTRAAFMLAFDLSKERLTNRGELGYLLRAAALAELLLAGHLADESGKPRARSAPRHGGLPSVVWEQISASPPRSWRHWIRKESGKAVRLVRDELAHDRVINVERRRILLFPLTVVTPRKAYLWRRLADRVGQAIRGGRPVTRMEQDARVLAALAAAARMKIVLNRTESYRHRKRIEQLSEPVKPITTALRKNIDAARSAATAG